MPDIRIINVTSVDGVIADWLQTPTGALDETEELANVVKVALMTDRLASTEEILPDPDSTDRRGWWGDTDAEILWGGWPIGCRNWLMTRAKITEAGAKEGSTLVRIRQYTLAALQPLIDQRICSSVKVDAVRSGRERIDVLVTIFRGPQTEISLRFQNLWTDR